MGLRRWMILALAAVGGLATLPAAHADDLKVLETGPAADAVLSGVSNGFFVRFNQPVDHVNSRLLVKRGGETVETLQPRLQSNPNVLFARASTLPPGKYTLHWVVRTLADTKVEQGDVPFSIAAPK
jgi:methionine-rich copper-binding protein CopC